MKPIIQLDQRLIDKIAAGEVVERPLSVVKELLENAIDAGAGAVTVEIADGGLTSIRVTDNGAGIPAEQLDLAFSRHATSKIERAEDLFAVGTLGFRGEALSSIAAVAQVEMITKTRPAAVGTRMEVHASRFVDRREVGCADGTTLIVSNLFYNVPARRKFLKKASTEAGYISDCLQKLALGNPRLALKYISNGKPVFQTNGNGDLRNVVLNIYGRETAGKLLGVDAKAPAFGYALSGYLGKPETARGNRSHATFFINGRYIQSKLLSNAVEGAFKTLLPHGKFPVYILLLTLPPDALDVNVHPTKMDVRFADEDAVCGFVRGAVQEVLGEYNLTPAVRLGDNRLRADEIAPEQIELASIYRPMRTSPEAAGGMRLNEGDRARGQEREKEHAVPSAEYDEPQDYAKNNGAEITPPPVFRHYHIIGLVFNTYWLVAQGESLLLIDQHAAHERVLYEKLLNSTSHAEPLSQPLIAPVPLRLTPREADLLRENEEYFTRMGFEIAQAGPALVGVPLLFKGPVETDFFMEVLDKLADASGDGAGVYSHKTELIAQSACKAAVKAGDALTEAEAHALIEELLRLENPFTCPHGRPTTIEITRRELERRFKRG